MEKSNSAGNRPPVVCEALEGREFHSASPWSTVGQFAVNYGPKLAAGVALSAVVKYGFEQTGHVCPAPWYVPKFGGVVHIFTCARPAQ